MMNYKELIDSAIKAKENAYAPYSDFRVGASLLTIDGKIYTGSNIENVSYGLSICAERVAIYKAVSEGEKNFVSLGLSSDREMFITPCGACLQVIIEFCNDLEIILINNEGDYKTRKVEELLPGAFKSSMLIKEEEKLKDETQKPPGRDKPR